MLYPPASTKATGNISQFGSELPALQSVCCLRPGNPRPIPGNADANRVIEILRRPAGTCETLVRAMSTGSSPMHSNPLFLFIYYSYKRLLTLIITDSPDE